MKKAKKLLFMSMIFAMILALFPNLLLKISAASIEIDELQGFIYANGNPITIEEGSRPELTKIKYGNNEYLDFGGGATEKDLLKWNIAGGAKSGQVENTDITMTGGKIGILFGGGQDNGLVKNDVSIDIRGGTISTLYGGGLKNSPVEGNVNINFSGGQVINDLLGGGTQNSPVKKVSINISGGEFDEVFGGGFDHSHVDGDIDIKVSNDAQIKEIVGGAWRNSVVSGSIRIKIEENATVTKIYGGGYQSSLVKGNTDINITGGKVVKVDGEGADNESLVEGKKNGTIKVPTDTAVNTFDNLIGKDKDGNWNIKGNVTLGHGEKIVVDEGKILNILSESTLTLNGEIENNGTIDSKGNLEGTGTLSGNGSFKTSHDTLTSDDIELQTQYPYTGEEIIPIHRITKKIAILGQQFEISNWNFTGTEPTPVRDAGLYRIIYKKDNTDTQVTKEFNVTPVNQGGIIRLKHEDKNNDNILNTGDILSVNMDGLDPKGGTPAFSWKRIADNSEEEIGTNPTYTITDDDRGKQIYCIVTFSGNTTGELHTNKLTPKLLAPVIEFPTASSISFGKKLKDSILNGGSTQYGTFKWKDAEIEPVVNNAGYEAVFTANDDTIAKYEPITSTTKLISINVTPVKQGGSIILKHDDKNHDQKLNAGDELSVNMDNLLPKGGTPSYSWKKKTADVITEIATTQKYTIKSEDDGKEIYCVVTFSGNTEGSLESNRIISKLPAPVIEFPTASAISFGKKLKDSILRGGSTQYGSFAWKNPEIEPSVNNAGYEVVFIPSADTIAKYEKITTTNKKIKITVYTIADDVDTSNSYEKSKIEKKKNPDKKKTEPKKEIKFRDVKPDDYFAEAVIWAIENKITMGTSENTFSPYDVCTRGQIVSFLWRAAGSPSSTETNTFSDIPHDAYYNEAVKWATTNKIVNGTDSNTFNPEIAGTRAQSITMLYRYFNSPEVNQTIKFDDVQTGSYYEKAIIWAMENGITKGTGENKFSPDLQCNRAQIITFLYRLYQLKTQN